ncbi:MAG: hypothetical protein WAO69_12080 [Aestuariivita sp.]|uniref:hypothetical protein n=1 Tax=Aestuariivita sp. TaxID=1872407 RepID=UPI003BB0D04D
MENLQAMTDMEKAQARARTSSEGGMTADDLYMIGGKLAAMFCIAFAFLVPSLLLWRVVF